MAAVRAAAPAEPQGYINFRTYTGDQRAAIRAGTATPDGFFYPKRAEGPYNGYPGEDPGDHDTPPTDNYRDNYNMELIGYFYPPRSGRIQFAIASDDPGELWVSTDDNPANKVQVASESQWNPVRAFAGGFSSADPTFPPTRRNLVETGDPSPRPENWSPYIQVEAGKPYFIQAIATEFGGGDNLAVAFRYEDEDEFIDSGLPIPGEYLSPFVVPTEPAIVVQPQDAAVIAGSPVSFSVGLDIPPGVTLESIRWTKNGQDITDDDDDDRTLTVLTTVADNNAKFKAFVTTSGPDLESREATLSVVEVTDDFSAGVIKAEFFTGIGGTAVDGLINDPKYLDNTPDEIRILGALDTPNSYGDNYGARITGVIIPEESGDYRFFIRSDDASRFYLNTEGETIPDAFNDFPIAEEFGCCQAFLEPGATQTSEPVTLQAGRRYGFLGLVKEGGGGDFFQVAWRREEDTTPAASLQPLSGNVIGGFIQVRGAGVTINQQPSISGPVEVGKSFTLTVDADATPVGLGLPVLVQWQKDGQDIPGATGPTLTVEDVEMGDAGTYRAVLRVGGSDATANSSDVAVQVIADTTGPTIAGAGAVRKGNNIEIGVAFDEAVDEASVSAASAYTLSAGTISAVRYVPQSPGVVLVTSGVNPGSSVTVTATNIKDVTGNTTATTSHTVNIPAQPLNWVGVGGDELNETFGETKFSDDVVARSEKDFDLISGGSAHWTNYDEETFVYAEIQGDFDKVVRVEYQDPVTQWSRAGLDAREALDEGMTRDDVAAGYKFSQHFTVRVNPPAVLGWDGRTGNNAYEVIHRPIEGMNYDGFPAAYNILNGSSEPPAYPNAWLRLKREGQKLTAFRSSDGVNWNIAGEVTYTDDELTEEDETLADTLFVGIFYAPEFLNIPDEEQRRSRAASVARFRDYGDFGSGPGPGPGGDLSIELSGTDVVITFEGNLEQAPSITGPWTPVTGTSPLRVSITANQTQFFRRAP